MVSTWARLAAKIAVFNFCRLLCTIINSANIGQGYSLLLHGEQGLKLANYRLLDGRQQVPFNFTTKSNIEE